MLMNQTSGPEHAIGLNRRAELTVPEIATVDCRDVEKRYPRRRRSEEVVALDSVDLVAMPGEFVVLLGPSGCGKTTLLRSIAGLDSPTKGKISLRGRTAFSSSDGVDVRSAERELSMVFQGYALWPHMTAAANIAYPLKARRLPAHEVRTRVAEALGLVGLSGLGDRYPSNMSGGQQQRVALARSLATRSDLILFDEPLSNVDAKVREQLRTEIKLLHASIGFTAIYVTHDQTEAMELADTLVVMDAGHVSQSGRPTEVYGRPANLSVARFIGSLNETRGRVEAIDEGSCTVLTELGQWRVDGIDAGFEVGQDVVVAFRPENGVLDEAAFSESANEFEAFVRAIGSRGSQAEYFCQTAGEAIVRVWQGTRDGILTEGSRVRVRVRPEHVLAFPA